MLLGDFFKHDGNAGGNAIDDVNIGTHMAYLINGKRLAENS